MTNEKRTNWIVNILGVLVALFTVTYIVRDYFHVETVPPCHASYPPFTAMSLLNQDGEPITHIELQALAGAGGWGLRDGLTVEAGGDVSRPVVLRANLKKGDGTTRENPQGGAGFLWAPSSLREASAVCLVYDVWIPKGFSFGGGGILPGVSSLTEMGGDEPALRTALNWSSTGKLRVDVKAQSPEEKTTRTYLKSSAALKKDAWTRVHQEINLGDPGKSNGALRVWVNGELSGAKGGLLMRDDAASSISSVLIHASFGSLGTSAQAAPKDTFLRFTPPEVSWK